MTRAVVVFSGGLDSTVVLLEAVREMGSGRVLALTFDCGQEGAVEVDAARSIAALLGVEHEVAQLPSIGTMAGELSGLPSAFVPSRNMTFFAVASAYALSRGATIVMSGIQQPYGIGYPDCSRAFADACETAVRIGNLRPLFEIRTPLMTMTKRQVVERALELNGMACVGLSVSCYKGTRCGVCNACVQRAAGFSAAGVKDPAL